MGKRKKASTVSSEITARLGAVCQPRSANKITAKQVKEWAVEYLSGYDDELAEFPRLAGKPHWDLWMMDAAPEDAVFVVLIFRAEDVEFICGKGDSFEVRQFAESDFPKNVDKASGMMQKRFSIPDNSVRFQRPEAEKWLGRSW